MSTNQGHHNIHGRKHGYGRGVYVADALLLFIGLTYFRSSSVLAGLSLEQCFYFLNFVVMVSLCHLFM